MARCVESGWVAREVLREAYRHAQEVERGERLIVGENIFQSREEAPPTRLYAHDPNAVEDQLARLAEVKATRDGSAVERTLGRLKDAAAADDNVMPATVECVRAYATLGEVCGALREVFGTFQEPLDIFG
jgi:methylmalonyl-CoA mutase N-terminal domain/subunit